jgi:hypothetical protein
MRKSPNVGVVLVCLGAGRLFHACGDNETNSDDTDLRQVMLHITLFPSGSVTRREGI